MRWTVFWWQLRCYVIYFWLIAYSFAVLLANVFLADFIPFPFFGLLSIGTIFFGAVFTLRDRIHQYGLRYVFIGIFMALSITTIFSIYINPLEPRFIIASFVSILMSELADTWVFEKLKTYSWTVKVLASNSISVPLDSILFSLLAFTGIMTAFEIGEIIFADLVVKYLISLGIAVQPLWVKKFIKNKKARNINI